MARPCSTDACLGHSLTSCGTGPWRLWALPAPVPQPHQNPAADQSSTTGGPTASLPARMPGSDPEIVEDQVRYGLNPDHQPHSPAEHLADDVFGMNPPSRIAILKDRIVHNAYRLELSGQSLRKTNMAPITVTKADRTDNWPKELCPQRGSHHRRADSPF